MTSDKNWPSCYVYVQIIHDILDIVRSLLNIEHCAHGIDFFESRNVDRVPSPAFDDFSVLDFFCWGVHFLTQLTVHFIHTRLPVLNMSSIRKQKRREVPMFWHKHQKATLYCLASHLFWLPVSSSFSCHCCLGVALKPKCPRQHCQLTWNHLLTRWLRQVDYLLFGRD